MTSIRTVTPGQPFSLPPHKRLLYSVLACAIGLVAAFFALEVAFRFLPVREPFEAQPVDETQPYLRFKPNNDLVFSMGWKFDIVNRIHVNNYGFVNGQDYDASAAMPLVAVIGDSYIEAAHVQYAETLQGRLAHTVGKRGRVYSFASSGSALSQYLAYAEYAKNTFRPGALVVLVIGNDFDESLLEYKSDPGHHYLRRTDDGSYALELIPFKPTLLHRTIRKSALARYVHGNSFLPAAQRRIGSMLGSDREQFVGNVATFADDERIKKSKEVVDYFLSALPRHAGLEPRMIVLLVDGMRPELYDAQQLQGVDSSYVSVMRQYLIAQARSHTYNVVDLQPRFIERHRRDGARFEWQIDSHWNRNGHEEAAAAVVETGILQRLLIQRLN